MKQLTVYSHLGLKILHCIIIHNKYLEGYKYKHTHTTYTHTAITVVISERLEYGTISFFLPSKFFIMHMYYVVKIQKFKNNINIFIKPEIKISQSVSYICEISTCEIRF